MNHNDRPGGSLDGSGEAVAQVLAGIAEDVMRLALEPPGGEPLDLGHLRRLLSILDDWPGGSAVTLREAVEACLARPGASALERLAGAVRGTVSRPVRVEAGLPHRVIVRAGAPAGTAGTWLGYLLPAAGGSCWLALGCRRRDRVAATLDVVPDGTDERYRRGPIDIGVDALGATVLLSVEYRAESLPSQHAMVNDLHAMVILHDVLIEDVRSDFRKET
jgi:hypothetical protein